MCATVHLCVSISIYVRADHSNINDLIAVVPHCVTEYKIQYLNSVIFQVRGLFFFFNP